MRAGLGHGGPATGRFPAIRNAAHRLGVEPGRPLPGGVADGGAHPWNAGLPRAGRSAPTVARARLARSRTATVVMSCDDARRGPLGRTGRWSCGGRRTRAAVARPPCRNRGGSPRDAGPAHAGGAHRQAVRPASPHGMGRPERHLRWSAASLLDNAIQSSIPDTDSPLPVHRLRSSPPRSRRAPMRPPQHADHALRVATYQRGEPRDRDPLGDPATARRFRRHHPAEAGAPPRIGPSTTAP